MKIRHNHLLHKFRLWRDSLRATGLVIAASLAATFDTACERPPPAPPSQVASRPAKPTIRIAIISISDPLLEGLWCLNLSTKGGGMTQMNGRLVDDATLDGILRTAANETRGREIGIALEVWDTEEAFSMSSVDSALDKIISAFQHGPFDNRSLRIYVASGVNIDQTPEAPRSRGP